MNPTMNGSHLYSPIDSCPRTFHKACSPIFLEFPPSERDQTVPEAAMRGQNGPFPGVFTWQIGLQGLWDVREQLLKMMRHEMDQAFSPLGILLHTWGDAPGWYQAGPLALQYRTTDTAAGLGKVLNNGTIRR